MTYNATKTTIGPLRNLQYKRKISFIDCKFIHKHILYVYKQYEFQPIRMDDRFDWIVKNVLSRLVWVKTLSYKSEFYKSLQRSKGVKNTKITIKYLWYFQGFYVREKDKIVLDLPFYIEMYKNVLF